MICFKFDLIKTNECISQFNKYKKDYYDSVVTNYNFLDNIDACWNDANSTLFKNKIRDDRFKVFDYYSGLDDLFNNLNNLNGDLEFTLNNFGYSSNSKLLLKFDNSQLSMLKRRLSNTRYYLKEALYVVNNSLLDSDYKNMNTIYNLRRKINSAIDIIDVIKKNTENFCNSVENTVEKYNNKIKEIDGLGLKVTNVTFEGNLVDLS